MRQTAIEQAQALRSPGHQVGVLEAGARVLDGPEPADRGRGALTLDAIRWQYLHGVPDESVVSPDTWHHDFALVSRPEIFGPEGALAFAPDAPDAEIRLIEGGHFLLESQLDTVASYVRAFLARALAAT